MISPMSASKNAPDADTVIGRNLADFSLTKWDRCGDVTSTSYRLESGEGSLPLRSGRNLIGRDREAQVHLDAASVSRRHALIEVSDSHVLLSDLGSKNGTYVGGVRISGPVAIPDREPIRLGDIWLIFRTATER